MIKIGIVGENMKNDAEPIRILLKKKYDDKTCQFIPLLKNINGDQLENIEMLADRLNNLKKKRNLNFIIFLRDLDAHPNDKKKRKEREDWFNKFNKITGENNLFFLIIFELESLIFADLDTFNKKYKTKLTLKQDPLFIKNPKEELRKATRGKEYKPAHAQEIFKELNFQNIKTKHKHPKHPCFHTFIEELNERLN